jgi:hypothetical protein
MKILLLLAGSHACEKKSHVVLSERRGAIFCKPRRPRSQFELPGWPAAYKGEMLIQNQIMSGPSGCP